MQNRHATFSHHLCPWSVSGVQTNKIWVQSCRMESLTQKKKQWWIIVVVQGWDEGQGALLPPLLPVVSADQGLMMDVYWTACCYWQMIAQRKVTLSRCLATILNPKKKIPVGGFCYNINALLADKMAHLRATSWPLLWNSEAFICLSMGHESHALHNYSIRHCLQFCQEK